MTTEFSRTALFQLDLQQATMNITFQVKKAFVSRKTGQINIICVLIKETSTGHLISLHNWCIPSRHLGVSPWKPFCDKFGLENMEGMVFSGDVTFYHYPKWVQGQKFYSVTPNLHDIADLTYVGFKPLSPKEEQVLAQHDVQPTAEKAKADLQQAFANLKAEGIHPTGGTAFNKGNKLAEGGQELALFAGVVKKVAYKAGYHPHVASKAVNKAWARS